MNTDRTNEILSHFILNGTPIAVTTLGSGLINDTFKVSTVEKDCPDYVLQRINHAVFTDVALLQHNIEAVTAHIRARLEARGEKDIDRKVLHFVSTREGATWHRTPEGDYWRVSVFIPRTQSFDAVTPPNAYDAGSAFGGFESMLADLDEPLGETIPDFHNMRLRLDQLRDAVARDAHGRLAGVRTLVDSLLAHAEDMCLAERLHAAGLLPKRICHCDSKVGNVLFDEGGGVLGVIDLDTVMPSFVFSDYGDFLRTAANATVEDDPDESHVALRWDVIESFTRGYIESTRSFLTATERTHLPFAMPLFPYMQCVRFLADYLNGDTYYKTTHPGHNLERAHNQFRLYQLAEAGMPRLSAFISSL